MYIQEKKAVPVRLVESRITIPNIYDLEKVGAGHDGTVFRCEDLAIKLLKYDVAERKEKNLMTYDKANYFSEKIHLKRIVAPIDTMLDSDGVYAGYVMKYIDNVASEKKKNTKEYKNPGDFSLWDLAYASAQLEEDFNELTKNRVVVKDINRGSYIYGEDFMYICDTDKYIIVPRNNSAVLNQNVCTLNFTIAKFLFYEMQKSKNYNQNDLKILSNWVKKACNSRCFLEQLNEEIDMDPKTPISEYADYKVKQITR